MLRRYAAIVLCSMLPIGAFAASVTSPVIDVPYARGSFTGDSVWGDVTIFNATAAGQGFEYTGNLATNLFLNFSLSNPYSTADGFFQLTEGRVTRLDGILKSIAPQSDGLVIFFDEIEGDLAYIFGRELKMQISFFELNGGNPISILIDGGEFQYTVEGTYEPAPVPLPASGFLLLTGFGFLAFKRKAAPRTN